MDQPIHPLLTHQSIFPLFVYCIPSYLCVHPLVLSSTHSSIHPSAYSSAHPSIRLPNHPFAHLSTRPSTHPLLINTFTQPLMLLSAPPAAFTEFQALCWVLGKQKSIGRDPCLQRAPDLVCRAKGRMQTCFDPRISGESPLLGRIFWSIRCHPLCRLTHGLVGPTNMSHLFAAGGSPAPMCFSTGSKDPGPTGLGSPLNHFPLR